MVRPLLFTTHKGSYDGGIPGILGGSTEFAKWSVTNEEEGDVEVTGLCAVVVGIEEVDVEQEADSAVPDAAALVVESPSSTGGW